MKRLDRAYIQGPKSFTENAAALYAIQGVQYLIPLIVLPVLTRKLGTNQFGVLMFWQALAGGVGLLIEYGFNYSAVRAIGRAHLDLDSIGRIFYSTLIARFILLLPACAVVEAATVLAPTMSRGATELPWLALLYLLGTALSPHWYLAGLRLNRFIAAASAASQVIAAGAIWALVKDPGDLSLAACVTFSTPLITAILSHGIIWRVVAPPRVRISTFDVTKSLRDGFTLFLATTSAGTYSALNPLLLGLVAPSSQVAYYALGEKLARAARSLLNPVLTALFPFVSSQRESSNHTLVRSVPLLVMAASVIAAGLLASLAGPLVRALAGSGFEAAIIVTAILAANVVTIPLSNLAGIQFIAARGHDQILVRVQLLIAPIHIAAFLVASKIYGATGAAVVYAITEALVALFLVVAAMTIARNGSS